MDTARFFDDLTAIPEAFAHLADAFGQPDDGAALRERLSPSRVLVLGMGSSRYAAGRVARAARALGHVVIDELASTDELPPPADDLAVIAISATGGSAEVLHAVDRYRGTGRLIAVTNRPESALAEAADAVSLLHAGVEASGVACRTYRHTVVVLERLLGLTTAEAARRELDRAATATASLLADRDTWLEPLSEVLLSPAGTHVLAPAERLCSAQQSALMVRELPRRLAVACETGDWAHVDLYTARTHDYRAAIFPGSHWDAQAVDWLQRRKARYAAIGGELDGAELVVRFPGDEDARIRPLTELLPLELVADRWRAADPEFAFSGRPGPA
ncbi:SIS domain-containing protein [Microcella sp.]|uniref:SIS domain-containing protein n=1 Tax=Microcella sp. TaxID=1913979 RepID=UPI00391D0D00